MARFKNGVGYAPKTQLYSHICTWCGHQFTGSMDKRYCSDPCRVNAWRASKRLSTMCAGPVGWLKRRFVIFERDGFKCRYCGRAAETGVVLEIDHVIPRSFGGSDDMDNLVTACHECNMGKADRLLEEYKAIYAMPTNGTT